MRHAMPRKRHVGRWVALGVLVVVLGVLGIAGVLFLNRAQEVVDQVTQGRGGSPIQILMASPLNGESSGRVNVLLAGSSFDEQGHDGAALTDSIMVASMDLKTNSIAVVSIPRDLWVSYRGQHMKINAVFAKGAGVPADSNTLGDYDAGMKALGQVATTVTGLEIDHYALVGYGALKDIVDAVGGIDIVVRGTENKGIYDPAASVDLKEGPQHIDGLTALRLSRARNDPQAEGNKHSYGVNDNDFGRTRNQRVVMAALLDKVKNSPALANPATILAVFDTVSHNVRSDLTVGQVRRMYDLSAKSTGMVSATIKGEGKIQLLLDNNVHPETPAAKWSLIPAAGTFNYSAIRQYIAQVCGITAPPVTATTTPSTKKP